MAHASPRCFSLARPFFAAATTLLFSACGADGASAPDVLAFAAMENVAPGLVYLSEPQTVSGLDDDAEAAIGISGADCAYAINDDEFHDAAGSVGNGDVVRVRGKAADNFETATFCTLDIGGVSSAFNIDTGASTFSLNVLPGEIQFSWGTFIGVTRYELTRSNSVTGESVFIADDIEGTANTFAHPVAVHLADWINDRFLLSACNEHGCTTLPDHVVELVQTMSAQAITYVKASNTESSDQFGFSVALSGDTLAVGAFGESSDATGVDSEQDNNDAPDSGAVYVFRRDGSGTWVQEAYIKASNTGIQDRFGESIALSDGLLAVGAPGKDSVGAFSGAVYVFRRDEAAVWTQEAYLEASNAESRDLFGYSVALSDNRLAVGARGESSEATGVNGDQDNNNAELSGAVYVFRREDAGTWSQEAYIKASNTEAGDGFGYSIALSGNSLAVGAFVEDSSTAGVNGEQGNNDAADSGAVYVFRRENAVWIQDAYLKASNTGSGDLFGSSVALSGNVLAVGAPKESSKATGVNGEQGNDDAELSGAVYVFHRGDDSTWTHKAYFKASNTEAGDNFGAGVALSDDLLVIGANGENSEAAGVNGDQTNNDAKYSGAVYVFRRDATGNWTQSA